jgi:hypothetical protein
MGAAAKEWPGLRNLDLVAEEVISNPVPEFWVSGASQPALGASVEEVGPPGRVYHSFSSLDSGMIPSKRSISSSEKQENALR